VSVYAQQQDEGARHIFVVENVRVPVRVQDRIRLEPRAIYEIGPDMSILRRRTDRIASSTKSEYRVFLRATDILAQH